MSGGPEPGLPTWARPQAQGRRPTWVVVLAVAMLAFGGHLLMNGLSIVRGLKSGAPAVVEPAGGAEQALARDVRTVSRALEHGHPLAVRLNAGSKVGLALLLLYAAA